MASKKYDELADAIVGLVGGKDNISYFTHCVTRLRFNVKDKGLVNTKAVDHLANVMGSQWSGDQYQVIVGQAVGDVYQRICDVHGLEVQDAVDENLGDEGVVKARFSVAYLLDVIAGCVIPIVPVLMGVGMIKVLYTLAAQNGLLDEASSTYLILNSVNSAAFYFLPIYVGATAARKFGSMLSMGMLMGGIMLAPAFVAAVSEGQALDFFGIPVYGASYGSTIFPVILSVFVASLVERLFAKYSPEVLRAILVPMGTIIVMIPLTLCLLAPIGSMIGIGIAKVVEFLFANLGFLGNALFGVLFPIMVLFGMHTALAPISVQYMAAYNCEPLSIASFVSTCTLGAACLAVMLRTRDKNMSSTAGTCAITALIGGITEPALYGVVLRFKKPFYCALIGNFVGGAIAGIMNVMCYAQGPSNLLTVAKFLSVDNPMSFPGALLAAGAAVLTTFCLVYFFVYRKTDPMAEEA